MKVDIKIEEIQEFLPHRYPMLLVDRVTDMELGKSITAYKNITTNEPYLVGHFPGKQIMPGVLIVEAMAQASGILGFSIMNKTPEEGSIYVLAGVDKVRFRKRVRPGDDIDLYSKVVSEKRGIWKFECKAEINSELICSATILCADRKTA